VAQQAAKEASFKESTSELIRKQVRRLCIQHQVIHGQLLADEGTRPSTSRSPPPSSSASRCDGFVYSTKSFTGSY
jgi:hypothetical protein